MGVALPVIDALAPETQTRFNVSTDFPKSQETKTVALAPSRDSTCT